MSPIERDVIERKQRHILVCLDALKPLQSASLDEYRSDDLRKKGAEKYLTELAGAAVDLNYHLLVESGQPPPLNYRESFLRLRDLGILAAEDAERLGALAGLRNRLIHLYDQIDDEKVWRALREVFPLMARYLPAVRKAAMGE